LLSLSTSGGSEPTMSSVLESILVQVIFFISLSIAFPRIIIL
jgi:hypothetical protein